MIFKLDLTDGSGREPDLLKKSFIGKQPEDSERVAREWYAEHRVLLEDGYVEELHGPK